MAQLNINITPEFERDLKTYMKQRGFHQKSEALREALHEAAEQLRQKKRGSDFRQWRGMALQSSLNSKPRFKSHDDLWSR